MIPQFYIDYWRAQAPWPDSAHIEQDLILSRALVEIFSHTYLSEKLVFRGGTALQKLFMNPPVRYSEDIDLVQSVQEPIGPVLTLLREKLEPWLGIPKYDRKEGRVTLTFRFDSETSPSRPMKVKVEINTREHFSVLGLSKMPFQVESPWFSGNCDINIYSIEELLGTKLRALYQRKKGRDLFDLFSVNEAISSVGWDNVVHCFHEYMLAENKSVSRAEFEENMFFKAKDIKFTEDLNGLLSIESPYSYDIQKGLFFLKEHIYPRLIGDSWKKKG